MRCAEDDEATVVREGRTAFRDRIDVMQLESAPAVTCQVCEGAASVVREDARAVIPPGLGVVQSGHRYSLVHMLSPGSDVKPSVSSIFT